MLTRIGTDALRLLDYLGGLSRQTSRGLYWTVVAPFRGARVRWRSTIHQMAAVGVSALPVVCLITDRKSTRLNSSHTR